MTEETKKEEVKKEETKKVEVPAKFKGIVEEIEKMTVLDLSELVKILEEKFGVSAAAPVMAMAAQGGVASEGEAKEEKSSFNVELKEVGDKKLEVIKTIRDMMGKGLKEAKDFVDSAVASPQMIKEGATKEEAESIKKTIEEAGGKVELK